MKDIDKDMLIGWMSGFTITIIIVIGCLIGTKINADKEIKLKQIEVYGNAPEDVLEEER